MFISFVRTIILYFTIILAVRVMGKRQINQLQTSELVVTLLISDLAVIPMQDSGQPLFSGLIPILVLIALEVLVSVFMLKSSRFHRLVCGKPVVIIKDGRIIQENMQELRMSVEDLFEQLRQKDVFDISTVGYAVLETNGKLSVMLKPDENALTAKTLQLSLPDPGMPCLVVSDGKVIREHYDDCSMNDRELKRLLRAKGLTVEDVLIMTVDRDKNAVIVEKEKKV